MAAQSLSAFDGHYGLNFTLCYEHMIVMVRGKNLQGLVAALQTGTVDFIQEYHPELWDKPAADAPLIESIEVVVQGEQAGKPQDDNLPLVSGY
jgi:FixJ family two-component response regulator